ETFDLIGSDKVEGTDVYGVKDEKVGAIERVMINKQSGRVAYAVLSFGGFLGMGEDYYRSRGRRSPTTGAWAATRPTSPRTSSRARPNIRGATGIGRTARAAATTTTIRRGSTERAALEAPAGSSPAVALLFA